MADPGYDQYKLTVELQRYICPELIEAYLSSDLETLTAWTSQRVCLSYLPKAIIIKLSLAGRILLIAVSL